MTIMCTSRRHCCTVIGCYFCSASYLHAGYLVTIHLHFDFSNSYSLFILVLFRCFTLFSFFLSATQYLLLICKRHCSTFSNGPQSSTGERVKLKPHSCIVILLCLIHELYLYTVYVWGFGELQVTVGSAAIYSI